MFGPAIPSGRSNPPPFSFDCRGSGKDQVPNFMWELRLTVSSRGAWHVMDLQDVYTILPGKSLIKDSITSCCFYS